MIEAALYSRLTGFAGLSALVSTRVYPATAPQDPTFPLIVYNRISGSRFESLAGSSGLARPRFQFDVYATTYSSAKAVAEQIRLALQGFRGTVASVDIQAVNYNGDSDNYEEDSELYVVSLDFEIIHAETKPS